jgi:hypothetical protein
MSITNIINIIYLDHNTGKNINDPIIIDSDHEENNNTFQNPIIISSDEEEDNNIDEDRDNNIDEFQYIDIDDDFYSIFEEYDNKDEMLSDSKIKKDKKLKTDLSSTTIIENKSDSTTSSTIIKNNSNSLTSSTIIENKSERRTSTIIKSKIDITSSSSTSSTIIRTDSNGSTIKANPLLSLANYFVPQIQRPITVNCTLSKKLRIKNYWSKKQNKYYFCGEPYFEVKKSNIPEAGNGLFSLKEFKMNKKRKKNFIKRNTSIFYYEGKIIAIEKNNKKINFNEFKKIHNIKRDISEDEFHSWENSPDGNCVMEIYDNKIKKIIDGNIDNFNGTRFINDSKSKNKGNLAINSNGGFYVKKNINIGDELLFHYSPRNTYWKYRTEDKITFGNNTKGINNLTKISLAKKKMLKSFPEIPVDHQSYLKIKKNCFIKAPWLDGTDPKFDGLYIGYIFNVSRKMETCTVLFDDNSIDKNVKFSNITLVKKTCPYCSKLDFTNKVKYDKHTNKCRKIFLINSPN